MDLSYKGHTVIDLLPETETKKVLKPDDDVIIVNRGRHTIEEKHDGVAYKIPPQRYCRIKYAAAQHFQSRLVVPGTRNPMQTGPSQKQDSFIGIVDVDPPAKCEPFDDAYVDKYSLQVEAIDRSMLDPADADVRTVQTNAVAASLPGAGAGGSMRPQISGDLAAMVPPEHNAAQAEMAQTQHEVSAMAAAATKGRNRARAQRESREDDGE